jgi:Gpi18-like mannosyltransferase
VERALASPWQTVALQAALLWTVSRLGFLVFTYFAVVFRSQGNVPHPMHDLLEIWNGWDARWYMGIAREGYHIQKQFGFFPLFPALTHLVGLVLGHRWLAAGLAVSNLAALAAFVGLGSLAYQESSGDRRAAVRSVKAAAAYPLAFFTFAPFTESLFLAAATWCLYATRRGWWALAAGSAFTAVLTRPTGVILMAPMLYEFGRQHGWWAVVLRRPGARAAVGAVPIFQAVVMALAVPAAFATYFAYVYRRTGNPLLWLQLQRSEWHHVFQPVWTTAIQSAQLMMRTPIMSRQMGVELIDAVSFVAFLLITVVAARRLPLSFTLYMAGLLLLCVASPVPDLFPDYISSTGRYLTAAVPAFLVIGGWLRRSGLELGYLSAGFMLQALFTQQFMAEEWIG